MGFWWKCGKKLSIAKLYGKNDYKSNANKRHRNTTKKSWCSRVSSQEFHFLMGSQDDCVIICSQFYRFIPVSDSCLHRSVRMHWNLQPIRYYATFMWLEKRNCCHLHAFRLNFGCCYSRFLCVQHHGARWPKQFHIVNMEHNPILCAKFSSCVKALHPSPQQTLHVSTTIFSLQIYSFSI